MLNIVTSAGELESAHLRASIEAVRSATELPLQVFDTVEDLYDYLARSMLDELKTNNMAGRPTRWILPVGPKEHYRRLAEWCNAEGVSWANVFAFHMDEFLDWQGRPVDYNHPFSFRKFVNDNLYTVLEDALRPASDQIIFPNVYDPGEFSRRLEEVGGADTCFAGYGYRGHVAFNEPPNSRWHKVTLEEFERSTVRIVELLEDTIIAHSERTTGGYTDSIPRKAVTLGMREILGSRRVRLITDGGSWKQFITRILLLTRSRDIDYPVTLAHGHPNVDVIVDKASIAPISLGINQGV